MPVGHDLGVREIHLHQVLITMPSVQILDVLEQVVTITLVDPFQSQGTRTKTHEDERTGAVNPSQPFHLCLESLITLTHVASADVRESANM